MVKLSIVCITKAAPNVISLLGRLVNVARRLDAQMVVGYDAVPSHPFPFSLDFGKSFSLHVDARGYQETVQDGVISLADGEYVLRIDDDEEMGPVMTHWIEQGGYLADDHWCFRRAWLYGDEEHFISTLPHWPDYQTRLSVKAKAHGHRGLHPSSPFGMGRVAPGALLHHKLLVTSRAERAAQCAFFDSVQPGAGMRAFYLPEEVQACEARAEALA